MAITHNLGFPRIGDKRQLKFALEGYWKGEQSQDQLLVVGRSLREGNWRQQAALDFVPVGDFSFYDQVLDMSVLLGNLPKRLSSLTKASALDDYFRVARGRSVVDGQIAAGEMTKWFNTNYHYIVPELESGHRFSLNSDSLLAQVREAKQLGVNPKPVIIGPVTYLHLSKTQDDSNKLDYLEPLLPVYNQLLQQLADEGCEWVQIDEPVLTLDLDSEWRHALTRSYHALNTRCIKILIATYFEALNDNLLLACELPVEGLHIDAINASSDIAKVIDWLPSYKVLSLGVIDGRNIWKSHLTEILSWLEPINERLGERLWLAPSCSLLHVPVDLDSELSIDADVRSWLAFAKQKLNELNILASALNNGRDSVAEQLQDNLQALTSRKQSNKVHNPDVKRRVREINASLGERASDYPKRSEIQAEIIKLPLFPTTTIGSFPQTDRIRSIRRQHRLGEVSESQYQGAIRAEIAHCVKIQEEVGLDVLVHGEAERNDMVEYFGQQLSGYAFTEFGWVQSYGSRCVKPPIIVGDIVRAQPMTVEWSQYAQSLTSKVMKAMLTGPVTLLNWSFVRDDQPRKDTCYQLALAIRDEVQDLEAAGLKIIQIDEAALREGLPLRRSKWDDYLDWAVESFRICAGGVKDQTQIHTHMCYSQFNDILPAIAAMDADVITIETSRSNGQLLDAFKAFAYPNSIGPGVYDIHSPNIPSVENIVDLMRIASERIAPERLWVNPDCGLKTRGWSEVRPALEAMVNASAQLRELISIPA